jgi:hypothetical protein
VAVVLEIRIGTTTITCSPEHPFWVPGRGWRESGTLRPGTPLLTDAGHTVRVDSIRWSEGRFTVFNLEVEGSHTYHVSELGILVHNKAMRRTPDSTSEPEVPGKRSLLEANQAQVERLNALRENINKLTTNDRAALLDRAQSIETELQRLQSDAQAAGSSRRVQNLADKLELVKQGLDQIGSDRRITLGLRGDTIRAIDSLEAIKQDPVGDVNQVANKNHYNAARLEAQGEVVARKPDGSPFDHIKDLQQAYNGLQNVRRALDAEVRSPLDSLTERGLNVLLERQSEVQALLSRLKGFLDGIGQGPPYPPFHQWPPGT